jgi:hypothetical protein
MTPRVQQWKPALKDEEGVILGKADLLLGWAVPFFIVVGMLLYWFVYMSIGAPELPRPGGREP